ncbi:PglL family O-oligosaccharyltransferase [Marinobacter sp. AL4B]|uniref:PglL family O-oligosaccharyltransferase n=1 Tax=Marinobacter sp. AL4B TaxID=2871173 RepID=UPI001CAA5A35|nr:O-antigen ligase family protein [Marinobacter sp. AL4B]MBZ0333192.1 Wzy polymerase domain-containing protein [Marinobacter sp. AL4B]
MPAGARPYANLAQPNNFSSLIWLSLFSLYYIYERNRIGLIGLLFGGIFLVSGAALAQSRTSWVVFSVLIVVALIHWVMFRRYKWERFVFLLLSVVAFYFVSLALIITKSFLFGDGGQVLRTGFGDIRTDMWMSFLVAIIERPWIGYGWGQVSLAQLAVENMYPAVGLTQYSHNLFLDLLIWNGIPLGLTLFVLLNLLWGKLFFVASSSKGFYSLCCFSVILIHGLLEYPHAYSYFLLLAGFFIGISARDRIDSGQLRFADRRWHALISCLNGWVEKCFKVPKHVSGVFVFLFSGILAISWWDYRVLEEDHRLLRFEIASIGTLKAERKAPDVVIFDQLQSFIWVARTQSFNALTANERGKIENVARRYALPMPLYKLAKLSMAENDPEKAAKALKTISYLHGGEAYSSAVNAFYEVKVDSAAGR